MTSFTAGYYLGPQPGQAAEAGIVTVDSIAAGHAWLIKVLTDGAREQSVGFAEVIDTVDDRALTHVAGSRASLLAELVTCTQGRPAAAAVGKDQS